MATAYQSCRYGSKCKLNHPGAGRESSGEDSRPSDQSTSRDTKLTDGRCYQWQLNDGKGWLDVDNDHILEAQYSLPHSKGIKIFNTPYGAVSLDFNRMRVLGKSLRVRRLDDGKTVWIWYCTLSKKWTMYGGKDSKGNPGPVKSCDIEKKFQSDPSSSYTFTIGADAFEIKFKEMRQVTAKRKRKVTRRPLYRENCRDSSAAASALQALSLDAKPKWQWGDRGAWYDFKRRPDATESSVTSEEIERKYVQNPAAGMTFKAKGQTYKLDFQAMTQINLKTKKLRNIRRL
ncbi:uncharacterized protein si:ch211-244b2.4 [Clinocottus analis]|uniref:uncharacterized protein si:ch211-244b2.4 n=1 Tax=Clinocottus analis TaxID=304258 RepID=UPI0035C05CC8